MTSSTAEESEEKGDEPVFSHDWVTVQIRKELLDPGTYERFKKYARERQRSTVAAQVAKFIHRQVGEWEGEPDFPSMVRRVDEAYKECGEVRGRIRHLEALKGLYLQLGGNADVYQDYKQVLARMRGQVRGLLKPGEECQVCKAPIDESHLDLDFYRFVEYVRSRSEFENLRADMEKATARFLSE